MGNLSAGKTAREFDDPSLWEPVYAESTKTTTDASSGAGRHSGHTAGDGFSERRYASHDRVMVPCFDRRDLSPPKSRRSAKNMTNELITTAAAPDTKKSAPKPKLPIMWIAFLCGLIAFLCGLTALAASNLAHHPELLWNAITATTT